MDNIKEIMDNQQKEITNIKNCNSNLEKDVEN